MVQENTMSVQVKTPTKAQFQHPSFPCGDQKTGEETLAGAGIGRGKTCFQRQESCPGKVSRKRRFSERSADPRHGNIPFKRRFGGACRPRGKIVLPTKFLLGGNINDPLNLNSLFEQGVHCALNDKTPVSSPLPTPAHRKHVEVLIPPNITDPLNLNSGEDLNLISPKTGNNRKKRKRKRKSQTEDEQVDGEQGTTSIVKDEVKDFSVPMTIEIASDTDPGPESTTVESTTPGSAKGKKSFKDKIVSPAIPQISPKMRKRKHTMSNIESTSTVTRVLLREDSDKSDKSDKSHVHRTKPDKTSPYRPKYKRQQSNQTQNAVAKPREQKAKEEKFIYGNYNRYYGYRNPGMERDERLEAFQQDWFDGKDVLDIGCNVGHVTLTVARDFHPRRIVGVDLDVNLIKAAKKNVRHYLSSKMADTSKFPSSMSACYGPISAPSAPDSDQHMVFPNNCNFIQANYVLDRDELLETIHEEYDVIMGLSLTKWIHLNFGDEGLKRAFKRMYRQLRPGGRLILEPQSWASYKKKKKISEKIFENFQKIRLKPDQFTEYLLSREVGFSKCELLDIPYNKSKGFQRPIQMYTKSETAYPTPLREPLSGCPTPLRFLNSRGGTPVSGFATPIQGFATPGRSTRELETRFTVGSRPSSDADTPSTHGSCSRCCTPSLESDLRTSPRDEQRSMDNLRTWSAPGLLESTAFQKLKHFQEMTESEIAVGSSGQEAEETKNKLEATDEIGNEEQQESETVDIAEKDIVETDDTAKTVSEVGELEAGETSQSRLDASREDPAKEKALKASFMATEEKDVTTKQEGENKTALKKTLAGSKERESNITTLVVNEDDPETLQHIMETLHEDEVMKIEKAALSATTDTDLKKLNNPQTANSDAE